MAHCFQIAMPPIAVADLATSHLQAIAMEMSVMSVMLLWVVKRLGQVNQKAPLARRLQCGVNNIYVRGRASI